MDTTVFLDDDLLAEATAVSGEANRSALLNQALRLFVATKRREKEVRQDALVDELLTLAGSEPDLVAPPRRRFE